MLIYFLKNPDNSMPINSLKNPDQNMVIEKSKNKTLPNSFMITSLRRSIVSKSAFSKNEPNTDEQNALNNIWL